MDGSRVRAAHCLGNCAPHHDTNSHGPEKATSCSCVHMPATTGSDHPYCASLGRPDVQRATLHVRRFYIFVDRCLIAFERLFYGFWTEFRSSDFALMFSSQRLTFNGRSILLETCSGYNCSLVPVSTSKLALSPC